MEESKKFTGKEAAIAKAERKSWKEAVALLQEASFKLRKGFLKHGTMEKIVDIEESKSSYGQEPAKPSVTLGLGPSSIDLEVVYQTDLRKQKLTKDAILKAFMDEIEGHDEIEIAYPHMQIVYEDRPKAKRNRKISQWIGKKE